MIAHFQGTAPPTVHPHVPRKLKLSAPSKTVRQPRELAKGLRHLRTFYVCLALLCGLVLVFCALSKHAMIWTMILFTAWAILAAVGFVSVRSNPHGWSMEIALVCTLSWFFTLLFHLRQPAIPFRYSFFYLITPEFLAATLAMLALWIAAWKVQSPK